jgi:hypothetical protein
MASIHIMLVSVLLVCLILIDSSSGAAKVKSISTHDASQSKPHIKCAPASKTCRPGDRQTPENTEEEAKAVNVPSSSSSSSSSSGRDANGGKDLDELPEFGGEMIILGH